MSDLNPRYAAYCAAHGASSPEEMQQRDRREWPGGHMTGFILWMKGQWAAWGKAAPGRGFRGVKRDVMAEEHRRDFDRFLWEQIHKQPRIAA